MKITDLQVDGFGVWNELTVDELSPEMMVFYGRNEAGKTTLMQFIRSMLYGFTAERRQRYLPPVYGGTAGGSLQVTNGDQGLQVQRLATATGDPQLGEVAVISQEGHQYGLDYLSRLLSGVDETIFNNVFAVGLQEIQELSSLNGTQAAQQLYKLASGVDRVSLIDVMLTLQERRLSFINAQAATGGTLVELYRRHKELSRELETKTDTGRQWIALIEERKDLERTLRETKEQLSGLERQARQLETANQIQEPYQEWRKTQQLLTTLDQLPDERDVDVDKLRKLNRRIQQLDQQLNELQAEAQGFKRSANGLPINRPLWQQAAKISALGEHQHWISSLVRQTDRLADEIARLEAEADESGSTTTHVHVPVTRSMLRQLKPAVKGIRTAQRQLELSQGELASTEDELKRLKNHLDAALIENNCESLGSSFQEAGQLVQVLRKRKAIDDRLDQLQQKRKIAEAELDETIQDQVFSPPRLLAVGAFVVIGVALILGGWSGLILKNMSSNPLMGFLGCGIVLAGLGLRRYWDYEAQDLVDQAKLNFDSIRQEIQGVKEEREHLEQQLPASLADRDSGRLQDAQRRLEILERLLPIEGEVQEASRLHEQATHDVDQARQGVEDARRRWKGALKEVGLPTDLSPTQVKHLAEQSQQVDQTRHRLLEARQQLEQYDEELASLRERILDIYADIGLEAEAEDPVELLRHLETELKGQQGLVDQRRELAQQYRQTRKRRSQLKNRQQKLKLLRTQLLTRVGVATEDEYRQLAQQHEQRRKLQHDLEDLDRQLQSALGHQHSRDDIFQMIDQHSKTSLESEWTTLTSEIERLETEQEMLHEKRGELTQQINQLADVDELEDVRLELDQVEQHIESAQTDWQEVAATCEILESLREFYEQHRQPETLKIASRYLNEMTGERYSRLWTRMVGNELLVDSDDEQGLPIDVLSRGTREAVFLSLRLALVAGFHRRGIRLPMVLDDVLVNFDSERARWAAEVLRGFAEEGHQILMFTCHEHMAEVFEDLGCDVRVLPYHRDVVHQAATVVRRNEHRQVRDVEPELDEPITLEAPEPVTADPWQSLAEVEQQVEDELAQDELHLDASEHDDEAEAFTIDEPIEEPVAEDVEPVAEAPERPKRRRKKRRRTRPTPPATESRARLVSASHRERMEWDAPGLWWQTGSSQD